MKIYKNNLQGGVFISNEWNEWRLQPGNLDADPLGYFLYNCTIKILTDSSISCITLKCDLINDGRLSPWKKFTSYAPFNDIRSILLKIFPHSHGMEDWVGGHVPRPGQHDTRIGHPPLRASAAGFNGYGGMERTDNVDFNREVDIQTWLYAKSFTTQGHYAESICPSILTKVQGPVHNGFIAFIRNRVNQPGTFVERNLGPHGRARSLIHPYGFITDKEVVLNILNIPISICVMDLLDGYDTLANLIGDPRIAHFCKMAAYELLCLTQTYGILHGDAHPGNIMINPDYLYFSPNPLSQYRGRVIIIDFGRSQPALVQHVAPGLPLGTILTNHINSNFLIQQLNGLPGGMVAFHHELINEYWPRRLNMEQLFINRHRPNMNPGETWPHYIHRITALIIPWAIDIPVNNPLLGAEVAAWVGHGGRRKQNYALKSSSIKRHNKSNTYTSRQNKIEFNTPSIIKNNSNTMASPKTSDLQLRHDYTEEERQKMVDNFEALYSEKLISSRFNAFKGVSKEKLEEAIVAEFRPPKDKLPEFTKEDIDSSSKEVNTGLVKKKKYKKR